jgi:hypothetical protein
MFNLWEATRMETIDCWGLLVLTLASYVYYYSNGDITLGKAPEEDAFLSKQVLLGLQMGGGLWKIQRGYNSHPYELPPIQKVGRLHYEYYFNPRATRIIQRVANLKNNNNNVIYLN